MSCPTSRILKLVCILTLGFSLAAFAQDPGANSAQNAAATTAPLSQFVFVPLGDNTSFGSTDRRMSEYRINPTTGALTLLHKGIKAQNIATFTFRDPKHRFLYLDGAARGSNFSFNVISEYRVDSSTGAITALPGSPFDSNHQELAFGVIRPDLKFAYIEDFRGSSIIHIISMNPSTGAMVKDLGTFNVAIGNGASNLLYLRFDPTGRFLYMANGEANLIDAYVSNPTTGALTQVRGAPFVPRGSHSSQCSPRQNFCGGAVAITGNNHLYYVSLFFDGVSEFQIDPTTGALTELPFSPAPNAAHLGFTVRVAPNGKHLYVGTGQGRIVAYTINTTTGKLTPVAGSPFVVAGQNFFMDIDETGHFLYTTSGQSISGFHINPTTGALSRVPGSPYSASGNTGLTIGH